MNSSTARSTTNLKTICHTSEIRASCLLSLTTLLPRWEIATTCNNTEHAQEALQERTNDGETKIVAKAIAEKTNTGAKGISPTVAKVDAKIVLDRSQNQMH